MSRNLKISLGLVFAAFAAVVLISLLTGDRGNEELTTDASATQTAPEATTSTTPPAAEEEQPRSVARSAVVRSNSHVLGEPGTTGVTFTEFLDFECESCLAAYPAVEQLREEYDGRVTFVIRYFPIPSHPNAMNAALAVEAAAEQDALEPMYQRMYETQEEWSHTKVSRAPVFRSFARDLGLDMKAYDAAVADPKTRKRVELDQRDGEALGVTGTPTFFLDDEMIQPQSMDDLRDQIDAAIAAR